MCVHTLVFQLENKRNIKIVGESDNDESNATIIYNSNDILMLISTFPRGVND